MKLLERKSLLYVEPPVKVVVNCVSQLASTLKTNCKESAA